MNYAFVLLLISCGHKFDGRIKPSSFMAAFDALRIQHALQKLGCDYLSLSDEGTELVRSDDLLRGEEACGYFDGKIVYAKEEGTGCTAMLHEVAHAMGYKHFNGPPLMWPWPPTLPVEEQAKQFFELTGCGSDEPN